MQKRLLTSKLTPPAASRYAVDRTEIINQVFLAFASKVVLIRAPAGFGKTTVMAQLFGRYAKEGTDVAWLNLDEADNDLSRLLSYLLVALKNQLQSEPTFGDLEAQSSFDAGAVISLLANQCWGHAPLPRSGSASCAPTANCSKWFPGNCDFPPRRR
jgi:LuxR family maltose regulon positive regulatory protein